MCCHCSYFRLEKNKVLIIKHLNKKKKTLKWAGFTIVKLLGLTKIFCEYIIGIIPKLSIAVVCDNDLLPNSFLVIRFLFE